MATTDRPVPELARTDGLQTAVAQVGPWSVTCGDTCGPDRRLRSIPRMSHEARIGLRALDYQLGNLCRPGLPHGLTCSAGCPRVTVSDRERPPVTGLMARQWPGEPWSGLRRFRALLLRRPPR
jgi:hypothetical protein